MINMKEISLVEINDKEIIDPKKPRKIEFNCYIGENLESLGDKRCPIDDAFEHQTSNLWKDLDGLKSLYEKVSKIKVTFEFIEENL